MELQSLVKKVAAISGIASPKIWEGPKCVILGE